MNIIEEITLQLKNEAGTTGILLLEREQDFSFFVINEYINGSAVIDKIFGGKKYLLHYISEQHFLDGYYEKGLLSNGFIGRKIMFDSKKQLESLGDNEKYRNIKEIGLAYANAIKFFERSKLLHMRGNTLDSFQNMIRALYYQAKLSILEHGTYPGLDVWEDVKGIDYETYKLYMELVMGEEQLSKRIELLLIANEFAIMRRIPTGAIHLKNVMLPKSLWKRNDLAFHPELYCYENSLDYLLKFLIDKKLVEQTSDSETNEVCYSYM